MASSEQQTSDQHLPSVATEAVLQTSAPVPEGVATVRGPDFNETCDIDTLLEAYKTIGFQATHVGKAIDEINRMISWRLSDEPVEHEQDDDLKEPEIRKHTKCTIFLGFTSNMISSGIREVIRFLVQHKMVGVLVTTGGGIEEDLMKCLAPHYIGDFSLRGTDLRKKGHNRIGNLIVPNDNYCKFEDWLTPILDKMHTEQEQQGINWTPSKMIKRLGLEIDNPDSVLYWAAKNDIPIFSPAITDGSIGDMLYFQSYKREGFTLDIVEDIRSLNDRAVKAKHSGMIILGGGLVKHHVCNANLMRNGADFSVFVNTGQEFDGSDSGAQPDEAISWGKIRLTAKPVKVCADASTIFPLIVSQTFARYAPRYSSKELEQIRKSS